MKRLIPILFLFYVGYAQESDTLIINGIYTNAIRSTLGTRITAYDTLVLIKILDTAYTIAKVPSSRTITSGYGITGGGDLGTNRVFSSDTTNAQATSSRTGYLFFTDWKTFNNKVTSVAAGNTFITIGGTATNPTVLSDTTKYTTSTNSGFLKYLDWQTFNNKIGSLNGLTVATQTFAIDSTQNTWKITSATSTHTFGYPGTRLPYLDKANTFLQANTFRNLLTQDSATINGILNIGGVSNGTSTLYMRGQGSRLYLERLYSPGNNQRRTIDTSGNEVIIGTLSAGATTINGDLNIGANFLTGGTGSTIGFGINTISLIASAQINLYSPLVLGLDPSVTLWNTNATTVNAFGAATAVTLFASGNRFIADELAGRPRFTWGTAAGTGITGRMYLPDSLYSLTTQWMDASRNYFNLGSIGQGTASAQEQFSQYVASPSLNLTSTTKNLNVSTATQAEDTSSFHVLFTSNTKKPYWEQVDNLGVKVARTDSTGALTVKNLTVGSATYPNSTTVNRLLYSSAANTISEIPTANNGTLVTSSTGVPSISMLPIVSISTLYETAGRFTQTTVGTGTATFGTSGLSLATGTTATSSQNSRLQVGGTAINVDLFTGTRFWCHSLILNMTALVAASGAGSSFFGVGAVTVSGSGHTYTNDHVGWKVTKTAGTVSVFATIADGSTEQVSSSLTTVVDNDVLQLNIVYDFTSGTYNFYVNKNAGTLATASLNSNLPTSQTNIFQTSVSNNATAFNFNITSVMMSYTR